MLERESLIQRKLEGLQVLVTARQDFAKHIIKVHSGKPASTCHRCNNMRSGIKWLEGDLRDIREKLSKLG